MREIIPVLHNIRSLHNVGSIFRTADGAGCKEIILSGYTPSPWDRFNNLRPDFAKVALGAEKGKIVGHFKTLSEAVRALKKEGRLILGLEQDKRAIPYDSFHKKFPKIKKIALILGSEPKGLAPASRKMLDALIEIPMRGSKESLNVAVAFGIAVYALSGK